MLTRDEFRKIYGEMFNLPAREVTETARLGRGGSFDRAKLAAVIERHLGKKVPAVYTAQTLRELEAVLFGADGATAAAAVGADLQRTANRASPVEGFRCGIDIEPVASMPSAIDYLSDPFYTATFTAAEIVYCAAQERPAMHFAARWCAKEALRKCDPGFAMADHTAIELVSDEDGSLFLRHRNGADDGMRLPHAVSVTHTPDMAAATVVMGWTAPVSPITAPAPAPHEAGDLSPPIVAARSGRVPTLLATLALITALVTSAKIFGLY